MVRRELAFHTPTGPLAAFVAQMVFHAGYSVPHAMERFLPDGGVELIIDCTDVPKHIFDEETLQPLQTCRGAWVSGIRTRPITISAGVDSSMMVVVFHPFGAYPVFGSDLNVLRDTVVEAGAVVGSSVDALRERVRNGTTAAERFTAVEEWLLGRLALRRGPASQWGLARFAVDWIRRAPSLATIDTVAQSAGTSNKHLIASFRTCVGTTPKQYQRVLRFQQVVALVEGRQHVDWPQVALDCGFYDQAHLIRDFKHFSGFTPTEYMGARGEFLNYLPVE